MVLSLFRDAPGWARFHTHVRWRLFPFPTLLPYVPSRGLALDLGCGHGLFSFYLALEKPNLQIVGIDPDREKIGLARDIAARRGLPNLRFSVGMAEDVELPPCDVVSLVDVLYLIPYDAQERLLRAAAARLSPGGRLLLKDMSERPRWKAAWGVAQELLAVRVLHITHGSKFYFRREREWLELLGDLGLAARAIPLHSGYLHPHVLFVGERRAATDCI